MFIDNNTIISIKKIILDLSHGIECEESNPLAIAQLFEDLEKMAAEKDMLYTCVLYYALNKVNQKRAVDTLSKIEELKEAS